MNLTSMSVRDAPFHPLNNNGLFQENMALLIYSNAVSGSLDIV